MIMQLHFTAWNDFDSPDEAEELIQFLEVFREEVRILNNVQPTPIVVHCRF